MDASQRMVLMPITLESGRPGDLFRTQPEAVGERLVRSDHIQLSIADDDEIRHRVERVLELSASSLDVIE